MSTCILVVKLLSSLPQNQVVSIARYRLYCAVRAERVLELELEGDADDDDNDSSRSIVECALDQSVVIYDFISDIHDSMFNYSASGAQRRAWVWRRKGEVYDYKLYANCVEHDTSACVHALTSISS